MPTPARAAAFDVLLRVEVHQAHASDVLHSRKVDELSHEDRALCTELVMGVLRWRSRLDSAIALLSSQPLARLDAEVLTALRMAAYQLGWMRLPQRAAVHESVELVKRARKRSAVPFANAVLRKLAAKPEVLAPVLAPGPKTVIELAELYAHPLWLVERWALRWDLETSERICAYDQQTPVTAIRLRDEVTEQELRDAGVELAPGALLTSARRVVDGDVTHTPAFREGRAAAQDEASQLVALLLGTGERLLDCCAAPGGKTAILAERNPQAMVVAADIDPRRARLMRGRVPERVHVVAADALQLPLAGCFDRVLADVPCSGTGTLARNPEIKWRLTADDLADLHSRQVRILRAALERVAPGGRLLYSSCSLEREENEDVLEEALGADVRVVPVRQELERLRKAGELAWHDLDGLCDGDYLRMLPGVHPWEGFFAAIVQKSS